MKTHSHPTSAPKVAVLMPEEVRSRIFSAQVEDALSAMEFQPAALEATEERLFALRGLARKHDVLPDDLAGLVSLARDQQGIARLQGIDAAQDRLGPVGDLGRLGARTLQDGMADGGGILGPRIVIRHDDHVGMVSGSLTHQWALGAVAVAAGADDNNDPAHHMRAQRLQGRDHRAGLVGVIDIDRRAVAQRGNPFDPPGRAAQIADHIQRFLRAVAAPDVQDAIARPRREQVGDGGLCRTQKGG